MRIRKRTKNGEPKAELGKPLIGGGRIAEEAKGIFRDPKGRILPGSNCPAVSPGRGRGRQGLTKLLRHILEKEDSEGISRGHKVMEALIEAAESKDPRQVGAVRTILERIDGKVPDVLYQQIGFFDDLSDEELDEVIAEGEKDGA